MTTGEGVPQRVSIFSPFALIPFLSGLTALAISVGAGAQSGSWAGVLVGTAIAVLLVPLAFLLAYAVLVGGVLLFLFVCGESTAGGGKWPSRIRTALRVGVMVAAVIWLAVSGPYLRRAWGSRDFPETFGFGVVAPLSAVFLLFLPALEKPAKRREQARRRQKP